PETETTLQQMKLSSRWVPIPSSDPANQIVRQTPDAYTKLNSDTSIVLYVSEGPKTPPASGESKTEPPNIATPHQASADVLVRNTLSNAAPFHAGDQVEFTLVVENDGPSPATGVRLFLRPENLKNLRVSIPGVSTPCAESGCAMPELAPDANSTVYVAAQIVAQGSFGLTGAASAKEDDPQHANNAMRAGDNAGPAATPPPPPPQPLRPSTVDLAVQSVLEPGPPYRVGDEVTVSVFVRNGGPAPATEIRVSNVLNNLRLVKQPDAACVAGCTVPRLAANESIEFTIRAQIVRAGKFSATTSVAPSQVDSGPGPLSATSEGGAESAGWPWPPSPIAIAIVAALGLFGAGGAFHLIRKAWWIKRIHVRVQLDASDCTASAGALHVTGPAIGIRISVLPGRAVIERLPIEREETSHER
ncbi:MAG: hypothetical protein JSS21_06420, partial [Proteobacteria bacterium]|nr:hypothetical protein [Pseudomonadota bacterium]